MDKITDLLLRLKHHDWFYRYSDDHRAYLKGIADERQLLKDLSGLSRHEREFILSSEAVPHELRDEFRTKVIDMMVEISEGAKK